MHRRARRNPRRWRTDELVAALLVGLLLGAGLTLAFLVSFR